MLLGENAWRAGAADDADRAATTQEQFVDATRHEGVRDAIAVLRGAQIIGTYPREDRRRDVAQLLAHSVERQARIAGVGRVHIPIGATA